MKGTMILGIAGIGVVGFLGYKWLQYKSQFTNGNAPLIPAGDITYRNSGQNSVQPQPRVDNANEPYYGGSQAAIGYLSQQSYDMANVASYLNSGSSIIHSATDIWDNLNLSEMFGGETENIADMDFDSAISWDANDNGMGGLDVGPGYSDEYSYA